MSESLFRASLTGALKLPGAIVDREGFLAEALAGKATDKQIREALATSPSAAGVEDEVLMHCCEETLDHHLNRLSVGAFCAGIPGGLALLGAVPADLTQYFLHMVIFIQKTAYLTGWHFKLSAVGPDGVDPGTLEILTVMMGVLFDVPHARLALVELGEADQAYADEGVLEDELPTLLTQERVREIEEEIELSLVADTAVKGVFKLLPVLGSITNGGFTYLSFRSQARLLVEALTSLKWARRDFYHVPFTVE